MLEYEFCEGYYEAGVTLAHRFRNDEGIDRPRPGMALPMLFCFRHYLELWLKSLCVQCACLVDEESPERLTNEHGLMPLWNTAKELIQRAFPTLPVDSDDPQSPGSTRDLACSHPESGVADRISGHRAKPPRAERCMKPAFGGGQT